MLYISTPRRSDWSRLPFLGDRTGARIEPRHRSTATVQPELIQRRENTSSVLVGQGEKLLQVKDIYDFRKETDTARFLRAHPSLIDLLLEAPTYVERYFGPNPQVVLEVVADREADDSDELFAYIRTSLPVEEALARLDQLDEGWFLAQLERTAGRFNFNLEFA